MKSKLVATFVISMIVLLARSGLAEDHGEAAITSHELEEASVDLHNHLRRTYGSAFGANKMKSEAAKLHEAIHGWEKDGASETETTRVVAALERTNVSFREMEAQLRNTGFSGGLRQHRIAERQFRQVKTYLDQLDRRF